MMQTVFGSESILSLSIAYKLDTNRISDES